MPMFNVNIWAEIPRAGMLDLIDLLVADKKIFAATRPAAIVLAEAERAEAAASGTPPYDPATLSFSVDRLQEVV